MQTPLQQHIGDQSQPPERARAAKRPHVYELDQLRVMTALAVVAVHVFTGATVLDHTQTNLLIQNAFITAFHFTREVFMFVTAFALTYAYFGKPFSGARFWRKRSIGVLFPYALWTLIYLLVNPHPTGAVPLLGTFLWDLLTGAASFQLYYILLSIQLYALLPVFLVFLRWTARHPWRTLAISFVLQLIYLCVDYYILQTRQFPTGSPLYQFMLYRDRFVLVYQFYFVLGGVVALHLAPVRAFVLRYGRLLVGGLLLALATLWASFLIQTVAQRLPVDYAISVLQPTMLLYSVPVIAFLYWLSYRRVAASAPDTPPAGQRFWRILSDASFGLYLIHPLFLRFAQQHLAPGLIAFVPTLLLVPLIWAFTVVSSTALSVALIHIPILSRSVGRAAAFPARWRRLASQSARPGGAPTS